MLSLDYVFHAASYKNFGDSPEIGDMDEGIVEGCENAGDTEDEFTCA